MLTPNNLRGDGEPKNICDEHSELEWFTPDEISKLDRLAREVYPELAKEAVALLKEK